MRDIVLSLFFVSMLPFALRHTWAGILLWTWFSIMNPHRLTYGFAFDAPFAMVTAIVVLVSVLIDRKNLRFPGDPAYIVLMLFMIWMCITTVFAFNPQGSVDSLSRDLKIDLMTLVAAAAIRNRKQIEFFVWVNAASIGFYGVKGGLFTILSGGGFRVWGPAGSFIEGNNEIGLALVITIPLINYLRLVSQRAWVRQALLASMLLSAAAALGTQSRGAFLAIAAMALVMWTRSQRKLLSGVLLVVTAVMFLAFMPASWEARMRTIDNYQQDGSAMGRINAWVMSYNLANDRLTGGGLSIYDAKTFARYAPDPNDIHAAHSIYFQTLGQHGWPGMILFCLMGALGFWTARQVRREARGRADTLWAFHLAGMIQVSMVGYAVGGAFLSLAYFDLPYNVLVMLIAARHWLQEKRWQTETHGAFGASVPVGRLPKGLVKAEAPPR